eukprot:CAMPEP_0172077540 /NCGR_PEP_ID=MMETSP1043-20130122/17116_1 /TAXON_ID=464988 /ORGANISM="Hemiselmis andersenii, Strain CCMP441" /LENGTH=46 /DNA_ID= /DNA_START= /DNA_END= /DNA_ORIENTATION=
MSLDCPAWAKEAAASDVRLLHRRIRARMPPQGHRARGKGRRGSKEE